MNNSRNTSMMRAGFSLLEILVVITIIGILASTMVFSYSTFVSQSQDARRKTDLENIRAAVELYRSNNDVYPTSVTFGGSICDPAPGDCSTGTYMLSVPDDPKTGYSYSYSLTGSQYSLCACLHTNKDTSTTTQSCGSNCPGTGSTCNYCVGPFGTY